MDDFRRTRRDGDDTELMRLFYDGDAGAFDELMERWEPRLLGYFRRLGFTREESEDLCQEVIVSLYLTRHRATSHGRFDLNQPLAPFLLTAARREAISAWRRKPAVTLVPLEAWDAKERPPLVPEALTADLADCMAQLPDNQHLYFRLCARHGLGELSHQEIAEILGKCPTEVSRLSRRAKDGLRNCMQRKGYYE
ncbi:MAG TPA: RNA polymerase sigma factor [Armatimonadota bacterium]|nr:RNA polymerase sigma factor [Armatimonadota bacterium]